MRDLGNWYGCKTRRPYEGKFIQHPPNHAIAIYDKYMT